MRGTMEITAVTPLEDTKKRKDQIRLLQLVIGCTDVDYIRAVTTVRRNEIPIIINAKRDGLFDYGQLLVETSAGRRWPPADLVIAAIEKAREGELTIDSPEWIDLMKSIGIEDVERTHDGTKIKGPEHLFHLVTKYEVLPDGSRKTKPFRATKSKTKKTASTTTAKKTGTRRRKIEEPPEETPEETPEENPEETTPEPSTPTNEVNMDSLVDQLAGAFQALDERISKKIDMARDETAQAYGEIIRVLRLLAKMGLVIYQRQEDIALDPMGDTTELSEEDIADLGDLINLNIGQADDEISVDEDEPVQEVDTEVTDKDPQDDDLNVIKISEEHANMSDKEFAEMISGVYDIEVDDLGILDKFSLEKVREIALRVGVPGAKSLNHRKLLIFRIKDAL